jgi:ADP-heptose:LPS heptosyltransferase
MFEAMVEALTRDPAVLPTFDFTPCVNQPLARFRPLPSEVAEINALLQRENPAIGSAPLILLNPNASDLLPLRRWPSLRYVELARRLLEHYPELFIAFTGAPAEAAPLTSLQTRSVQAALSRLPAKRLCVKSSCSTPAVRFW